MQATVPQQTILAEKHQNFRYLNTKQAAEILNLSPRTLERWRLTGGNGLAYRKFGKRVCYEYTCLIQWAENQTHTSTSDAV